MIYRLAHFYSMTPDQVRSVPGTEIGTMVEVMNKIRHEQAGVRM